MHLCKMSRAPARQLMSAKQASRHQIYTPGSTVPAALNPLKKKIEAQRYERACREGKKE